MLISLRTMVNTTIFWLVILLWFRWYTRWIDSTPAQRLLQSIGWDEFAQLSLPTETTCQTDVLYDKLLQLEGMMQATTITCAGNNFAQNNNIQPIQFPWIQSPTLPSIVPASQQMLQIAVFDSQKDGQLPPAQQANPQSLAMIARPVSSLWSIEDIIKILKNTTLTPSEQSAWYSNIFNSVPFSVINSTLEQWTLTLTIGGVDSFSSAQLWILESALQKTLLQFPQINQINIRY